jgi:hypothetical protein
MYLGGSVEDLRTCVRRVTPCDTICDMRRVTYTHMPRRHQMDALASGQLCPGLDSGLGSGFFVLVAMRMQLSILCENMVQTVWKSLCARETPLSVHAEPTLPTVTMLSNHSKHSKHSNRALTPLITHLALRDGAGWWRAKWSWL